MHSCMRIHMHASTYVCMYVYTHSHTHHHNNTVHAHILWQHTLFFHSIFMRSPNDFIFGLAFTVAMISQTSVKAFASHFLFKHVRRSWDCRVLLSSWLIVFRSPSDMICRCSSSNTMAVASTFSTNCCRQWWRNSAVERKEVWMEYTSWPNACRYMSPYSIST